MKDVGGANAREDVASLIGVGDVDRRPDIRVSRVAGRRYIGVFDHDSRGSIGTDEIGSDEPRASGDQNPCRTRQAVEKSPGTGIMTSYAS